MLGPYGKLAKLSSPKQWFNGLTLKKVIESGHGIHLRPLKPRIPECLLTPDRKIHIAPDVFQKRLIEVTNIEWTRLVGDTKKQKDRDIIVRGVFTPNYTRDETGGTA